MILFLLLIFPSHSQRAYYPKICPLLPEDLNVCIGNTYTFNLQASDPLNSPSSCSPSTSPEICNFVLLTKYSETSPSSISFSASGVLTFTPTALDIGYTFIIAIYDQNTMQASYSFNYYQMTDIYELTFTINNPANFPTVIYDQSTSECSTCTTTCKTCIPLTCGKAQVGKMTVPSATDQSRFEYSLLSSSGVEVSINSDGGFFIDTVVCDGSAISWSVRVSDYGTDCSQVIQIGNYYLNTAPSLEIQASVHLYDYTELSVAGKIVDSTNTDGFSVSITSVPTENTFVASNIVNGHFTITAYNIQHPQSSSTLTIVISDNGVDGQNSLSSTYTLAITVLDYVPVTVTNQDVYLYKGDWSYSPSYSNLGTEYYITISTALENLEIIDDQTGRILWLETEINQKAANQEYTVTYAVYSKLCGCTSSSGSSTLTITTRNPPIIHALPPLISYHSCPASLSLDISFYDLTLLSFSFAGFTPTLTVTSSTASISFTHASTDSPIYSAKVSISYQSFTISSSTEISTILSDSVSLVFTFPLIVAVASGSFTEDLKIYTDFALINLLTFSTNDAIFTISNDGVISANGPKLVAFLDGAELKNNTFEFDVNHCGVPQAFSLQISVIKYLPYADFSSSNFYCNPGIACTISLSEFIHTSGLYVQTNTFEGLPLDGVISTGYNSVTWTPSQNVGSSGDVIFKGYIGFLEFSGIFYIAVSNPPHILNALIEELSLVIGADWTYTIRVFSDLDMSATCTCQVLQSFVVQPSYDQSLKVLSWNSVTSSLAGSGTADELQFVISCYFGKLSEHSTSYSLTVPFIQKCQIGSLSTSSVKLSTEYSATITVTYLNSPISTAFSLEDQTPGLILEFLSSSSNIITYTIKYTFTTPGVNTLTFKCTEYFSAKLPLSNTSVLSITVINEIPSISSTCSSHVILNHNFACLLIVSNSNTCELGRIMQAGSAIQNPGILASYSPNLCTLTWDSSSIDAFGMNLITVEVKALNAIQESTSAVLTLYPNDMPILLSLQNNYDVEFGEINFNLHIHVTDSQSVTYAVTSGPPGLAVDSSGLVTWTSPLAGTDVSYNVKITITDSHMFPLSIDALFMITLSYSLVFSTPPCPTSSPSIIIGNEYSLTVPIPSLAIFSYSGFPGIYDSINSILTWTPADTQSATTTLIFKYSNTSRSCSFSLHPNSIPSIQSHAAFVQQYDYDFYYRLVFSDAETSVRDLSVSLTSDCPGLQLLEFEVVYLSVNNIVIGSYSFTVSVTDTGIPPATATENFSVQFTSSNLPPTFILPTMTSSSPNKQCVTSSFSQGIPGSIICKVSDPDTTLENLRVEITGFNIYGISISQDASDLSLYSINWTPGALQLTSGVVKVSVIDITKASNMDFFELIIYNVAANDFPPQFIGSLPYVIVNDDEETYFNFYFKDSDSKLSSITATIDSNVGNIILKGRDSVFRASQHLDADSEGNYTVTICSSLTACSSLMGGFLIKATNKNPVLSINGNTVFSLDYTGNYITAWSLSSVNLNNNQLYYCPSIEQGHGSISLSSLNLRWTGNSNLTFYAVIKVRVNKSGCPGSLTDSSKLIAFCIRFPCSLAYSSPPALLAVGSVLKIQGLSSAYLVYLNTVKCTFISYTLDYYLCQIPSNIILNSEIRIFIDNSHGLSVPFMYTPAALTDTGISSVSWQATSPLISQGLKGEVFTIVLSSACYLPFRCFFVQSGSRYEAMLYTFDHTSYYCVIPNLPTGIYNIHLIDSFSMASLVSPNTYNIAGPISISQIFPTTGHPNGGYSITVQLNSAFSYSYSIKFGEHSVPIIPVCSYSSGITILTFLAPPQLSSSTINVYVSYFDIPYVWSQASVPFTYSGNCKATGNFCQGTSAAQCDQGHFCDNSLATLTNQVPCSAGTFQNEVGSVNCKLCSVGNMCSSDGLTVESLCEAGFICDRSQISFPMVSCPPGHFCPAGTNTQTVNGYSNYFEAHLNNWDVIDHWISQGTYDASTDFYNKIPFVPTCISAYFSGVEAPALTQDPQICPDTYCLLGVKTDVSSTTQSWFTPQTCTIGYTCSAGDGESFDNSKSCNAGSFCPGMGYTGVRCSTDPDCVNCLCPEGYSCPYPSMSLPSKCPPGSYEPSCGQSLCNPCDIGSYCNQTGLVNVAGTCEAGYMCPHGTSSQKPCSTGTYNSLTGQTSCQVCPLGYYCPSQTMTQPTRCSPGYICNALGLINQLSCPEGYYCVLGTNSVATDACQAIEICPKICPIGSYCPAASLAPIQCEAGTYQDKVGQSSCKDCSVGYYCPEAGMSKMLKCPAGSYCESAGLTDTSGFCPGGYYCLEGTASSLSTFRKLVVFTCTTAEVLRFFNGVLPNEPIPCPPGTYCVEGTASGDVGADLGPKLCRIGTYANVCSLSDCFECDSGYSCTQIGTVDPTLCPSGTFRSGLLSVDCEGCPVGTWSGGKVGLGTADDCSPCPAGYICASEGIYNYTMMALCSAGFYCPSGTYSLLNYCPSGYMCPPGLSDSNSTKYPCPAGFICSEGTGITNDMLALCLTSSSQCTVGTKCPSGFFCPTQTSGSGVQCPTGTSSDEEAKSIYDCLPILTDVQVFGRVNALDLSNSTEVISLLPLSYATFSFSNVKFPIGSTPADYVLAIKVQGDKSYTIPFIQIGAYSPLFRLPLSYSYSDYLSSPSCSIDFGILAHKEVSVSFEVQILNGRYTYSDLIKKFESSVVFKQIQYSTRYNQQSFLAVLNSNSKDYIYPPSNLPIFQVLPQTAANYGDDLQTLVDSVSVSVNNFNSKDKINDYPQTINDFWSGLQFSQKLYPMDYLPYITDCYEFGSHIPLYFLFANPKCDLVPSSDTKSVIILSPFRTPKGDTCHYSLTCQTSVKPSLSAEKNHWFETYELSTSNIFYFTRRQFDKYDYQAAIPDKDTSGNAFSNRYYGSSMLIAVSSVRSATNYRLGSIPKKVKLYVGYYQKNNIDKELLKSIIYFEDFSNDLTNRSYNFEFVLEPLQWKDCLDLFAFEEYLYYIFVILVCLLIFALVVTFWGVNYVFSTILPRPNLKIKLYLNYSLRNVKGVFLVNVPVFSLIFVCSYILNSLDVLKKIPGSYLDSEPIDPKSSADTTRINAYMFGRIGTCISSIGMFMTYQSLILLFSNVLKAEDPKTIPMLNKETRKLRGLFLWGLFPVLIFSFSIYEFAKSDVYIYLQTLFIFIFKLTNTRIVEMNRGLFNDDLYVLPFYGAMTLTVMLVTVKVGAFTAFLTGYLTNIFIKIAKRTFVEPYRIEIKNKILKLKQKLKLGGSADSTGGLGFKDRVYIEQVSDLGVNSIESIVAWMFPVLIVFNYLFYTELRLEIPKDFLKYFIVFCFLQAVADIGYDIFLNNAIECRTGRLLSEKIIEIKQIFDNRECLWALSDRLPHSKRVLPSSLENLLRIGFSTQYFFLMSLSMLGIVLQIYAVELWVNWTYNPFSDPAAVFLIISVLIFCTFLKLIMLFVGKFLQVWKIKPKSNENEDLSFDKLIKLHISQELDKNPAYSKENLFYSALASIVMDYYDKELNEKARKAEIMKFLKLLEDETEKAEENNARVEIDELPLPKIRQRTNNRVLKYRKKVETVPLRVFGAWPTELEYLWNPSK